MMTTRNANRILGTLTQAIGSANGVAILIGLAMTLTILFLGRV